MTNEEKAFLADLTQLTKKHKLVIGGCGCCSSPYLEARDTLQEQGHYIINGVYSGEIVYIEPDDYYWKENAKIAKT